MKNFECACGQGLFFENSYCTNCRKRLGYDPLLESLMPLQPLDLNIWEASNSRQYRLCKNYTDYNICNWLVAAESADVYCLACSLNMVIPSLSQPENWRRWADLESAKRRLIYTLLQLNLPVKSKQRDAEYGLAFAFLEDKRSNPNVNDEHILTGHSAGLITINLTEADDIAREWMRQKMGENYRTLLGHLRHESGHYYFDLLIRNNPRIESFRTLFGDEREDYNEALSRHHVGNLSAKYSGNFISHYAQAHPLEDWAECWAHYLHMTDTLETAVQYGITDEKELQNFDKSINGWIRLTLILNSLNRSMGLKDAYPFVLSKPVMEKLNFVHSALYPR